MKDSVFIETDISHACPRSAAQVLGVSLMPLSLWHVWFLRSNESPYATGEDPKLSDLAFAIITCSMTREEMGRAIEDESIMAERALEVSENWVSLSETERLKHAKAMDRYLSAGMAAPEFWEDPDSDEIKDRLRCPAEWHLVYMLLKHGICQSEEQAWNYSYARAVCWRAVFGEQMGSRDYIDPIDRKHMEIVNANHK